MSYIDESRPTVVIFGRTNVGKSTLFNTLTEKHEALTADVAGTTRDANMGTVSWQGTLFGLIDTGGIIDIKYLLGKTKKVTDIDARVQGQAREFLKRADFILFLTDTHDGLLSPDKDLAKFLKQTIKDKKKILLVANKADNPKLRSSTSEFNKLGLGEPLPISAASGSGTGDLLDEIINNLPITDQIDSPLLDRRGAGGEVINVAIIGKPNVGKSSLLNSILGEERLIVSPTPHTTREPQDTYLEYKNKTIRLIDTAGISKRGGKEARKIKHRETLEKFSIRKSLRVLRSADIALLVIDISEDLTHQDAKLIEEILKTKTSLIVVANKWDLIKERDQKNYSEIIHRHFPFVLWVPIHFTSALTGAKVKRILETIIKVSEARQIEIPDNALSKLLLQIVKKHPPTKGKGTKPPYIYSLKQTGINPPKFAVRIGAKDTLNQSYLRFTENRLRDKFEFLGTPIAVYVDRARRIHGKHESRNA